MMLLLLLRVRPLCLRDRLLLRVLPRDGNGSRATGLRGLHDELEDLEGVGVFGRSRGDTEGISGGDGDLGRYVRDGPSGEKGLRRTLSVEKHTRSSTVTSKTDLVCLMRRTDGRPRLRYE